ncbi:MAG: invasion associated locus B family protein [Gammaproteobacteria bacterium]|nr:invasion associated locus B family protein [Gammaproteobacteria bacterium]
MSVTQAIRYARRIGAVALSLAIADVLLAAPIGQFGDWSAHSHVTEGRCYAGTPQVVAVPGAATSWLLITRDIRSGEAHSVSVQRGSPFKSGTTFRALIGAQRFDLFTQGANAWTVDAAADERMVNAMRTGERVTMAGTSVGNQPVLESFSLEGFTQALDAITAACELRN